MYYPELLDLIKKTGAKEAIEKLDKYLAFLPNRSEKVITPSNIATRLDLDFNIIDMIFNNIYEIGLFEKTFIVNCPECGREILISNQQELMGKIQELDYCAKCKKEDIEISPEDIYVGYKISKQPELDQDEIILETQILLGEEKKYDKHNELDTLKKLFEENKENPHDFFYNPSKDTRQCFKDLFNQLDIKYANTKSQGGALEGLMSKLFKSCLGMTPSSIVHTKTNQIDCLVRNDYCMPLTIYNELGSLFKAEGKNEPDKVPGNGYYHKLHGICQISKNRIEQAVGILFSRKKLQVHV